MQTLILFVLMALGTVVCGALAFALTRRWRLPWRAALEYFGLAPYPHETRQH